MTNLDEFQRELEALIHRHSLENQSDTPDFVLAHYLRRCLETYQEALQERQRWWGRYIRRPVSAPPALQKAGGLDDAD